MNLRSRIERLEQSVPPDSNPMDDRRWRSTLSNINKVYGDGQPVSDSGPVPTREEVGAIIAQAYVESEI
jgi:hypothetical protein